MSIKSENGRADEMTRNEILIIKADACQKIITLKIYVTNIFHIFFLAPIITSTQLIFPLLLLIFIASALNSFFSLHFVSIDARAYIDHNNDNIFLTCVSALDTIESKMREKAN